MNIEKLETLKEQESPFTYTLNGFDVTHYIVNGLKLPFSLRFFDLKAKVRKSWKGAIPASQLDQRSILEGVA